MAASTKSLVPDDSSTRIQDLEYLYASNANVSNFVSVKLSGKENYHLWKAQMLCLMETYDMCGIVDAAFDGPRASSMKIIKQYDSLLKGWIFGSVSEGVLGTLVNLGSAKDVWSRLVHIYVPSMSSRQDSAQVKREEEEEDETKDNDVSTDSKTKDSKTKGNDAGSRSEKTDKRKELCKLTMQGCWKEVEGILKEGNNLEREPLNGEGNTVLHLAVGIGDCTFIKALLQFIRKKEASEKTSKPNIGKKEASEKTSKPLQMPNSNGSTALHVAAIVGHKDAAELLVKEDKELLTIKDNDGRLPLFKAYSKMQFDTFVYLWDQATIGERGNAISDQVSDCTMGVGNAISDQVSDCTMGVQLLVNAISANKYDKASEIVEKFPQFAMENDEALTAIARNFPNGLDYWEKLIHPCSLSDIRERILKKLGAVFFCVVLCRPEANICQQPLLALILIFVPLIVVAWVYYLLSFLIYMVYLPFYFVYFLWWEVATRLEVPPVKDIVKKKKKWDEANKLLELVCNKIDEGSKGTGSRNPIYDQPILEAARQNAYEVVDEILYRSPDVIQSTDENGYDIIQLAVIHRSDKIYNLIYQIGERKSRYGTWKDSSDNNILHLVGRLAPSHELNSRTGAALQLQRELQWREELKKFVFPAYVTQENIFKETPAMVFTKEHKDLVKEGEKWMKATAESCSITAGLITTIVFAAAITVPGGNNQETGIPLFRNDIAFIIFAASDAISLFTSSTALLVFLSILTARFAEQDFLTSLPRRLIIGFCSLLLSTTAMMVSFSAILYLVFCDQKSWMIGLICGLAFIPIACFVALQFSLIVDLHRSTYVRIFGQQTNWRPSRFDPRHVQGYFK